MAGGLVAMLAVDCREPAIGRACPVWELAVSLCECTAGLQPKTQGSQSGRGMLHSTSGPAPPCSGTPAAFADPWLPCRTTTNVHLVDLNAFAADSARSYSAA
jgi:hypothetical protein